MRKRFFIVWFVCWLILDARFESRSHCSFHWYLHRSKTSIHCHRILSQRKFTGSFGLSRIIEFGLIPRASLGYLGKWRNQIGYNVQTFYYAWYCQSRSSCTVKDEPKRTVISRACNISIVVQLLLMAIWKVPIALSIVDLSVKLLISVYQPYVPIPIKVHQQVLLKIINTIEVRR